MDHPLKPKMSLAILDRLQPSIVGEFCATDTVSIGDVFVCPTSLSFLLIESNSFAVIGMLPRDAIGSGLSLGMSIVSEETGWLGKCGDI